MPGILPLPPKGGLLPEALTAHTSTSTNPMRGPWVQSDRALQEEPEAFVGIVSAEKMGPGHPQCALQSTFMSCCNISSHFK